MKKYLIIVAIVMLAVSSVSASNLAIVNEDSIVETKGKTDLDQS